tara:strand:- start:8547 stop:9296 length:750 start_codon:yes stop_codon:yes gene_type:complete
MEIKDNTLFRRYEFKYLLNSKIANQIKDEAKKFMLIDSYAKKGEDQSYFVRSLYFDNDEYQNFYDKVDGIRSRKKFRLRTYEKKLSKNNLIFLEIKGRHLERTFKKRTQIQSNHLKFFYDNRELPKLLSFYPNNDLVKDFVFTYLKTKIRPKVLIDYTRQPFINKYGLYFRLTFDSNLFSNKSKELFINESTFSKLNTYPGLTILELKFDRSIPLWFLRIIQSHNLNRKSISKFVLGMCKCNLAKETSD